MPGTRSLLSNVTPRGRIVLAVSALAILVLAFAMFRMATKPSYATMASGVDPADTGKITAALDERGIGYEIRNNGTAIAVEKSQTAQARIALAETGLPGKGKPGFELFDKQKLGASDFQQKVTYQRALEGEISRTIGQVDGVSSSQVQLTLPEDQLFSDESRPATAAVLVSAAQGLDPASVRGMARLVSSSVEGLKPENVTITDQSGTLLWPTGETGAAGTTAGGKRSAELRYEREMEASLNSLLLSTLGPGKGRVQVQADLDADERTQDKLEYARRGTPLKRRTEEEELESDGGGGAAAAGATGNIPTYAQGGGGGESAYQRSTEETDYGVDKTVTRTRVAPGTVNKQDVAVVLDQSVSPRDAQALEEALTSAAGVDTRRGDTLTMTQVAFAKPPAEEAPGPIGGVMDSLKYVLLGIATLVFLILVGRQLRRQQGEGLASEPVWLRELEAPTTLAELEDTHGRAGARGERTPQRDVDDLVAADPDRVAQQVRAWMKDA